MSTYLYGIVEATNDTDIGTVGIDGVSPVRIMTSDGLGCVISESSKDNFRVLSKEQLVHLLLAHQQVAECVMEHHTVLPVKFGTVLNNPQEALELLHQGRSKLLQAVGAFRDKVEIEVAATWDINQVLKEIGKEEEIVRTKEAIEHKGQPSLEERMHLGQMVKAYLNQRMSGYREQMIGLLKPLSVDVAPNALVSDEMVMNVAFLVERSRQHNFDEQVRHLDQVFQSEILFRVIGPLPPYSFSTIEVTRLTTQQIEEARQVLHLGEVLSEGEVRKQCRHLAAQEQQRLGPEDKLAQDRLLRLRQASELLLRYCQAHEEAPKSSCRLAPSRDGLRDLFSIAIKRAGGEEVESTRFSGAMRVA